MTNEKKELGLHELDYVNGGATARTTGGNMVLSVYMYLTRRENHKRVEVCLADNGAPIISFDTMEAYGAWKASRNSLYTFIIHKIG